MICTVICLITHISQNAIYIHKRGIQFQSCVGYDNFIKYIYKILWITRGKEDKMINVYRNICLEAKTITVARAYHEYW